jgi:ribosome maturation factor RimP
MSENSVVTRVREMVAPIVADLGVDLYDLEYAGGQLTVTLDTFPGSESGIALDVLALATRLISRELDHTDPIPGHYTLEVTSPGLERTLRTPAHFQREIGKTVAIRLRNTVSGARRLNGVLIAADEQGATVRLDDQADVTLAERVVPYDQIDRARTVFVWGPAPKPGKAPAKKGAKKAPAAGSTTSSRTGAGAPGASRPSRSADQSTQTETEAPA